MALLSLVTGHETTINPMGNGDQPLVEHPEQLERLGDDPAPIGRRRRNRSATPAR